MTQDRPGRERWAAAAGSTLIPVNRLDPAHIDDLLELYRSAWWARDRVADDVRRMLVAADVIVGFREAATQALVAFARALTDGVYKALVLDVIVAPAYRGTGLGQRLVDAVLAHPRLQQVRDIELYCRPEMVPFYERWGFSDDLGELRFMRLTR